MEEIDKKIELFVSGLNDLTKAVKDLAKELKETRQITTEMKDEMQAQMQAQMTGPEAEFNSEDRPINF